MKESVNSTIAAFDFDGTITTKDTLFDFLIFNFGKVRVLLGLCFLSPILVSYKLKLISNTKAKQMLFTHFYKGKNIDYLNKQAELYANRIKSICKSETLQKIEWHLHQNHTVIIISASIENWIKPWAKQNGITDVIGTKIELNNNFITGKFKGNNCYGIEKVNRLLEKYPNRDAYCLYAYGDSRGDKELLEFANYSTYIK